MSVKVTVNKFAVNSAIESIDEIAKKRYRDRRMEIGEEFVQIVTPYVPWDTGQLASSGHAYISGKDDLKVVWSRTKKGFDVANAQYYGSYNHESPQSEHWDQAAMYDKQELFIKRCKDILNR